MTLPVARSYRILPDDYAAAKRRAAAEGTTVSAVIVRALRRYARSK